MAQALARKCSPEDLLAGAMTRNVCFACLHVAAEPRQTEPMGAKGPDGDAISAANVENTAVYQCPMSFATGNWTPIHKPKDLNGRCRSPPDKGRFEVRNAETSE